MAFHSNIPAQVNCTPKCYHFDEIYANGCIESYLKWCEFRQNDISVSFQRCFDTPRRLFVYHYAKTVIHLPPYRIECPPRHWAVLLSRIKSSPLRIRQYTQILKFLTLEIPLVCQYLKMKFDIPVEVFLYGQAVHAFEQYSRTISHAVTTSAYWSCTGINIEAGTKWPPLYRRVFQIHFHEWKSFYFDSNFHRSLFLKI